MKIGIISDIHGNSFALEQIMKYFKKKGIKKLYCLGDLVGYYPNITQVFDLIRKNKVKCILGNHDFALIRGIPACNNKIGIKSFEMSLKKTNNKNLNFLKKLKSHLILKIGDKKILMVHGSPWNEISGYVYEEDVTKKPFDSINADIIIMGHTHKPFIKKTKKQIIANCGSVGQPRNSDKRASAIILDTSKMNLNLIHIKYNNKKAAETFKKECDKKVLNMLVNHKN